jgi:hypothetical protein
MYQFINKLAVKSVKIAGLALVVATTAGFAHAQSASGGSGGGSSGGVPEIDAGSMISALTLLTGGVLMISDKFRSK